MPYDNFGILVNRQACEWCVSKPTPLKLFHFVFINFFRMFLHLAPRF